MKITLTNGRTFIVKVHYVTEPKLSVHHDKYNRLIETIWDERSTEVTVSEWLKDETSTRVQVKGIAKCSYKDVFNKKIGRKLAYYNAITKLVELNIINEAESVEFDLFDLDNSNFNVTPKMLHAKLEVKSEEPKNV